jgi:organic radical activating enzyme
MRKIIDIKIANPKAFRLNFIMTRNCPYSCRYCPDTLHAGKNVKLDLTDLEEFFSRFADRARAIQLTGGECTTHPQFLDVIKLARKTGYNVSVDSNCVRTLRFYDEVKELVDNWCITLHPSQHTLDIEKLKLLSQHSFLVVYVMMDPDYWDLATDWVRQLSELKDLKLTPIRVMDNWAGANFIAKYTSEQQEYLNSAKSLWLFTTEREKKLRQTHMWLADTESVATYNDGSTSNLDAFDLIRTNTNNFYGWECSAGNESVCIYDDGTASWANCGIKSYNHFLDIYPDQLKQPVKCKFLKCTCGTDIRSSKTLLQ